MRKFVRRGVTVALAFVSLGAVGTLAAPAYAESIASMTVDATVDPDSLMTVRETIVYDFEGAARRGIFREVPTVDTMDDGRTRHYEISVVSVTRDGQPEQFTTTPEDPFLSIRIGDPDVTIEGEHTYTIEYVVKGALRTITPAAVQEPDFPEGLSAGDAELYWDYIGSGWQVPIRAGTATVTAPEPALAAACYTGADGGTVECPLEASDNSVIFGPVELFPGWSLTGITAYPATSFSGPVYEDVREPAPDYTAIGLGVGAVLALLLIAVPAVVALSRRRADAGVSMPLAPPQYSPPDDLSPAEMCAAWRGEDAAQLPRVVVSTLLDLAARRWIDMSDVDGTLHVAWRGDGSPALRPFEEQLVSAIFKGAHEATVGSYDAAVASAASTGYAELVAAAEASGRRNVDGDAPDRRWNFLALVGIGFIVLTVLGFVTGLSVLAAAALPAAVGAFIGLFVARAITPRMENVQSATFLAKVAGFERVLGTDAAASRREFAHRSGLPDNAIFATMLPYAVIFDLEAAWAGAYPDLTPEQLLEYGYGVPSALWMTGFVTHASSSMASAMTEPRTSSGSGFSSGGGFSGGGGGGGGGGSW